MRPQIVSGLALKGAGAALYLIWIICLAEWLPQKILAATLFGLGLSTLSGSIAASGWSQAAIKIGSPLKKGNDCPEFGNLARVAVVNTVQMSALAALAIAIAIWSGQFPLLEMSLAVDIGTLTILNAVSVTCASLQRANGRFLFVVWLQGPVRSMLLLATTATAHFGASDISTSQVLGIYMIVVCVCLVILIWRLPFRFGVNQETWHRSARDLRRPELSWRLFSHADMLIVGWVLSVEGAAMYLLARRFASAIGTVGDVLRNYAGPILAQSNAESSFEFRRVFSELRAISVIAMVASSALLLTAIWVWIQHSSAAELTQLASRKSSVASG